MRAYRAIVGIAVVGAGLVGGVAGVDWLDSDDAQAAISDVHTGAMVATDPVDWTPNVRGASSGMERVHDIAELGDLVIVVGDFVEVKEAGGGPILARDYVFAFDADTGEIDDRFAPVVDDVVETVEIAADGSIFLGGRFNNVNGAAQKGIVKVDRDGQTITQFDAFTDGLVTEIRIDDSAGRVYLGGSFSKVNNQNRTIVAAVNGANGMLDQGFNFLFADPLGSDLVPPVLKVRGMEISSDGSTMVVGGNFRSVDGFDRFHIAVIDLALDQLTPWATTTWEPLCRSKPQPNPVWDVDIDPTDTYFVVVTTAYHVLGGPSYCDAAVRFELGATATDVPPTWADWTNGDSLTEVEITGSVVYIGGHMRFMNGADVWGVGEAQSDGRVDRNGLSALDPDSGVPFTWRADRLPRGAGVWELHATERGLWVGSDTDYVAGEYHGKLALLPLEGGQLTPVVNEATLPTTLFTAPTATSGAIIASDFDGTVPANLVTVADSIGRIGNVGGATLVGGSLITTSDSSHQISTRSFDGVTLSNPTALDTLGLASDEWDLEEITGLYYHRGRLYYTLTGQNGLYYRFYNPESGIMSPDEYVATTGILTWSTVRGMEVVDGRLYYGNTDGFLRSRALDADGLPTAVVVVHGGPGIDDVTWDQPLFFLSTGNVPDPEFLPSADHRFAFVGDAAGVSWHSVSFPANAGQRLDVEIALEDPTTEIRTFLSDPNGTLIAKDVSLATVRHMLVTAPMTGTYRLGVKTRTGSSKTFVTVNPIIELPADRVGDWTSEGSPTFWSWQEFDVYPLGDSISGQLTVDPGAEVYLFVKDPSGNVVWSQRDGASVKTFTVPTPVSGRWRVAAKIRTGAPMFHLEVSSELPDLCPAVAEAELGVYAGAFVSVSDPTASNGAYIEVPDIGGPIVNTPGADRATICTGVTGAGNFTLDVVSAAPSSNANSFWVSVDGGPFALFDVAESTSFIADKVNDRNVADPVVYTLGPGDHYVTVALREEGTRLDTIAFAPVP